MPFLLPKSCIIEFFCVASIGMQSVGFGLVTFVTYKHLGLRNGQVVRIAHLTRIRKTWV